MSISVIVPCFNEAKNIKKNFFKIFNFLKKNFKVFEIILVNDGSTDNTLNVLKKIHKKLNSKVKICTYKNNIGRGRAIKLGIKAAKNKILVVLDADLSYNPSVIKKLYDPIHRENYDISIASAYHKEGTVNNVPFSKLIKSKLINFFFKIISPIKLSTYTCCVRGYKKTVAENLNLIEDDKEIHLEVLLKSIYKNYSLIEVPADLNWSSIKKIEREARDFSKKINSLKPKRNILLNHLIYSFFINPIFFFKIFFYPLIIIVLYSIVSISLTMSNLLINYGFVESLSLTFKNASLTFFILGFAVILLCIVLLFLGIISLQRHLDKEIFLKK